MGFISEHVLLAVSTVAVLVLVSALACREMHVRGDLFGPSLHSESYQTQVQGMAMVLA
jgi:hypothetical protein